MKMSFSPISNLNYPKRINDLLDFHVRHQSGLARSWAKWSRWGGGRALGTTEEYLMTLMATVNSESNIFTVGDSVGLFSCILCCHLCLIKVMFYLGTFNQLLSWQVVCCLFILCPQWGASEITLVAPSLSHFTYTWLCWSPPPSTELSLSSASDKFSASAHGIKTCIFRELHLAVKWKII